MLWRVNKQRKQICPFVFLGESMARQSAFRFYLTFRHQHFWTTSSFCQHSIILLSPKNKQKSSFYDPLPPFKWLRNIWMVPRHHILPMGRSFSVFIRFFVFSMKTFWHIATFGHVFPLLCFIYHKLFLPLNPKWDKWIVIDLLTSYAFCTPNNFCYILALQNK